MSHYLKYFYLFVFFTTGIYVVLFVSQNFASWKSLYGEIKNTKKVFVIPDMQVDGSLFSLNKTSDAGSYPCVNNETEALDLIATELEKEYNSPSYFELNVKPLLANSQIEKDNFFYKVKLPQEIDIAKYSLRQNFFDCSFFNPVSLEYVSIESEPTELFLGNLVNTNEENLNKLVDLLYGYQVIDLDLFGKKIDVSESNTTYTNDEVIRTDSGTYNASSGMFLSDDSRKYTSKLIFRLNIETGDVLFTKVIE